MTTLREKLAANLAAVHARIQTACERSRRSPREITLVAVTKTVSSEVAAELVAHGVRDLGENRPQELWRKAAILPRDVRWHLIGHLQRNKIERTVPLVHRIHAVDSVRLLEALDGAAADHPIHAMLEFNCSGEASKQGFSESNLREVVDAMSHLRHLRVVGLMTMAAFEEDPQRCRPTFAKLRHIRDDLRAALGDRHPLAELSMGMSNDFEVAIEEGSTAIRLGTVLFEGTQP